MIEVTLQDPAPSAPSVPPRPRSRPRRRLLTARRALIASLVLLLLLAIGWFVGLPLLLRQVIQQALRQAGVREEVRFTVETATPWGSRLRDVVAGEALTIARVDLVYSLRDLWHGRLEAIRLRGADVELKVTEGAVDLEPILSLVSFSRAAKQSPPPAQPAPIAPPMTQRAASPLPLELFSFSDSTLTLVTPARVVTIPVTGSMAQDAANQLKVRLDAGEEGAVLLSAAVDLAQKRATFEGGAHPGRTLSILRSVWPAADVAVGGRLLLTGRADWSSELNGQARLEIAGGADDPVSEGKLQLTQGVLEVEVSGPARRRRVLLAAREASFASRDGFSVERLSTDVLLTQLTPPRTPARQLLTAAKLTIGDMEFTEGELEFEMTGSNAILISDTRWDWLGGEASASDVRISPASPFRATLQVRDVELGQVLGAYAADKLEGSGRLSGQLPITVAGGQVEIGNGQLVSPEGGRLRVKDKSVIDVVAAQAGASEQVKQSITEALQDFVYERMTIRFSNDESGLLTRAEFAGHGRTGEKQEMSFDVRIRGVEDLLNLALGVQSAVSAAQDRVDKDAATSSPGKAIER